MKVNSPYMVIEAANKQSLENLVGLALSRDAITVGGVSRCAFEDGTDLYAQAVLFRGVRDAAYYRELLAGQ